MSQYQTLQYGDEVIVYEVDTGKVVDHVTEEEMKKKVANEPSDWYKFWKK